MNALWILGVKLGVKALNYSKEPMLGIFSFSPTSSHGICKREKRSYVIFTDRSTFWQVLGGKNIEFMCFLLSFGLVKVNLHPRIHHLSFAKVNQHPQMHHHGWMMHEQDHFFNGGSCCLPSLHIDEGLKNVLEIPNLGFIQTVGLK